MNKKIKVLLCLLIIASATCVMLYGWKKSPPPVKRMSVQVNTSCLYGRVDLQIIKYGNVWSSHPAYMVPDTSYMSGDIKNVDLGTYVSGWEVNWGPWSKDSYREYSAKDYQREAKGITNPTQADIDGVTPAEMERWFRQKHTSGNIFGNDPPYDIVVEKRYTRSGPTIIIEPGYSYNITGTVSFPNGPACKLSTIYAVDMYTCSDMSRLVFTVVEPCVGCGIRMAKPFEPTR